MDKIIITKEQHHQLTALQRRLPAGSAANLPQTTMENVMSAKLQLDELAGHLELLRNAIDEFETAVYDRDPKEMVRQMAAYTCLAQALKSDADVVGNFIAGSITRFLEVTTPSSFTVIVPDAEIRTAIDQHFAHCNVMSLGYQDGSFALIFGEDESAAAQPPFVFAKGAEECYDEARRYIEAFLDMEE